MIQGKDGQKVVVIVGGKFSKGMEVWNPRAKSVDLVADEIPPEKGLINAIHRGQLLTIKGGTEFIFYGGGNWDLGIAHDGIWKYIVSENSWTR